MEDKSNNIFKINLDVPFFKIILFPHFFGEIARKKLSCFLIDIGFDDSDLELYYKITSNKYGKLSQVDYEEYKNFREKISSIFSDKIALEQKISKNSDAMEFFSLLNRSVDNSKAIDVIIRYLHDSFGKVFIYYETNRISFGIFNLTSSK